MSDDAAGFVGSIPENYDCGLGPIIFKPTTTSIRRGFSPVTPFVVQMLLRLLSVGGIIPVPPA